MTCVESTYACNEQGQPQIWIDGKTTTHSRVVYVKTKNLTLADIKGKVVRHTCDNPKCVNPEHLILGTQLENMQDKMQRDRWRGGQPAKFSEAECEQIRKDTRQLRQIAKDWGVAHSTIGLVKNKQGVYGG